jgi:hypothetical protein
MLRLSTTGLTRQAGARSAVAATTARAVSTSVNSTLNTNTTPNANAGAGAGARRSFATVQDPPVRHYGGLKDQDRIFTNIYSRHDHGIKGAMVCHSSFFPLMFSFQ